MGLNAWQARQASVGGPAELGSRRRPQHSNGAADQHPALADALEPPVAGVSAVSQTWAVPLDALIARLRQLLEPEQPVPRQAELQNFTQMLEQLRAELVRERRRYQALELQLFDTQVALEQAGADLRGTQDGERKARHQALHDGLTQLPNRRYFLERLDHALMHRQPEQPPLAILYLDLDEFKPINDAHGHGVGDELLRIVATRLNRVVRSEDMVSRLGGDEFACLRASGSSREQLQQLADKLYDAVAAPMKIGSLQLSVRPSVGIALCPADGCTVAELLRHADAAMYQAKRRHCRHLFFDEL